MISKILYFNKDNKIANINYEELKSRLQNDHDGWLYCYNSEITNVYTNEIVIIEIFKEENMFEEKIKIYPKCKLLKKIYLDNINHYWEILKLILFEYQIKNIFFSDKKKVYKELKQIELIKTLDEYYNYFISWINSKFKYINTFMKKRRDHNLIIKICVKNEKKLMNKKEDTRKLIEMYSSNIRKFGFLVEVDSEEINYYYQNKIKGIFGVVRYDQIDNISISDLKVKRNIRIYNYEFAVLLLEDLLKGKKYSDNYYLCESDQIDKLFKKILKYFEDYDNIEKIKKAYLFDEYGIGTELKPIKIENKKSIEYVLNPRERILESLKKN